jgi:hypothetical protein
MKFQCSHCRQDLETDSLWAGHEVNCPNCGQVVSIPAVPTNAPPAATSYKVSPEGGGFGKFLFVVVLLAMAAFGSACYYFKESPQQVWQQLVDYLEKQIQPPVPPPIAKPTPVAPPAPAPVVIQPPAPLPATNIIKAAAPFPSPPNPLTWALDHKELSPQELTLLVDTDFPIIYNGHVSGSGKVPAGSVVKLVQIDPEKQNVAVACIAYGNGTVSVPIPSTDLVDRAKAAMAKADVDAKAEEEKKLTAAKAPPPAAEPSKTVSMVTPATNTEAVPSAPSELTAGQEASKTSAFVHPGLLHNDDDFRRMKENLEREPWQSGWQRLIANRHSSLDWKPRPVALVVRGRDRMATQPENYRQLFNDIAAAYACALRWRISGDHLYADKSVEIMNAWSAKLTKITGSTDADLAAGIYGYEFANAAEIMRSYDGWKSEDFARFQGMMINVFYSINHDFLVRHNGTKIDHYWCNWDACNMDSIIAIGVLCDRRDIYNEAVEYYKHGEGNGAIAHAVYYIHPDGLGQWQESGRDQGHSTLGIGLLGAFCEMAWKQGDDLYGYDNNRFLAGCEYVAKYNLGEDVPFKTFSDSLATQAVISAGGRDDVRPIWELVYNHYVKLKGLPAPYITKAAESVRPEGGGGDYGPNSGGFDQLGYGTLTFTRDSAPSNDAADLSAPKGLAEKGANSRSN